MRLAPTAPQTTRTSRTAEAPVLAAVPALAALAPELVEGSVVVEELATTVEAELAVGGRPELSLVAELDQAESLVVELDREVHEVHDRDSSDGWSDRSDEDLVLAARSGDDSALSALLTKYRAFARVKARSYFLVGADREDIVQEGMIGLYKAIRDFDATRETSFRAFAELCVTRQILTAIKSATRLASKPCVMRRPVPYFDPETSA